MCYSRARCFSEIVIRCNRRKKHNCRQHVLVKMLNGAVKEKSITVGQHVLVKMLYGAVEGKT